MTDEELNERFAHISGQLEILTGMQLQNEKRFEAIARIFTDVHASIKSLETVARAHEERLEDLEGE